LGTLFDNRGGKQSATATGESHAETEEDYAFSTPAEVCEALLSGVVVGNLTSSAQTAQPQQPTAAAAAAAATPSSTSGVVGIGLRGAFGEASDEDSQGGKGAALSRAIRSAALAAGGLPSLAHVSVNASATQLPTSCEAPRVHPPTPHPSQAPAPLPTPSPSAEPSATPSSLPSLPPSPQPAPLPSPAPSSLPSAAPTAPPSLPPTPLPSSLPTLGPSASPSQTPTLSPTPLPTSIPTAVARGQERCLCVSGGIARRLHRWCPEVAPLFDLGGGCVSNTTVYEAAGPLSRCPPLLSIRAQSTCKYQRKRDEDKAQLPLS